jgi:hypothetical protein
MAITDATGLLVRAATAAQQERKERGLTDPTFRYSKDPAWAQGLVSAAKEVAAATSVLVLTANDYVEGKVRNPFFLLNPILFFPIIFSSQYYHY